ncbi:hypothetical protein Pryu01_02067 [Paraliobacillus ryukyuensis]|uniref:Resolvase-like protein n=1 Tax=Paraliobacillus ryukyuensis TaxID=200904 RepID=A0A366E4A5_9BACI|nr:recombinase family protein [Paraliobacillus ryukyuensis]RBO97200.1 resolvase-like protein [Paraliobacillus ryukyuensis]
MNKSAIAYIRVSRMGTAVTKFKDKESPETQMSHISKYCEQKEYQIVSKYEDLDYSGGTDERPGFQKMFWEIRNNPKIDVVVVYSLSRFARDVLDLNKYLVELEKHNVDFVSVTEEFSKNRYYVREISNKYYRSSCTVTTRANC